jgi:hypothetical protein
MFCDGQPTQHRGKPTHPQPPTILKWTVANPILPRPREVCDAAYYVRGRAAESRAGSAAGFVATFVTPFKIEIEGPVTLGKHCHSRQAAGAVTKERNPAWVDRHWPVLRGTGLPPIVCHDRGHWKDFLENGCLDFHD